MKDETLVKIALLCSALAAYISAHGSVPRDEPFEKAPGMPRSVYDFLVKTLVDVGVVTDNGVRLTYVHREFVDEFVAPKTAIA